MSSSESKKKQMISRSTQTIITNEDFNRIKPYQSQMSNEDFRNMFIIEKSQQTQIPLLKNVKKFKLLKARNYITLEATYNYIRYK